jgi:hypothetical protein
MLLSMLLFLTAAATGILNWPPLFYEPLTLAPRVAIPALLLAGYVGVLFRSKLLRLAGWVGIVFFTAIVLVTAIPGEDYVLSAPTPDSTNGWWVLIRFGALMAIAVALMLCMRRLTKP